MAFELTNDQIFASFKFETWWKSKTKQVFEISGKPGTGKSTLIRYCIERIGLTNDEVMYVAFAGKAVSVFLKNGLPGKTIHSAIYNLKEVFVTDEDGKKVFDAKGRPVLKKQFVLKDHISKHIKLIVLDEGSMVSSEIAKDLLSFGIPIVVLGDLNQLPPVMGDQFFLNDPDVVLNQIMRQAEGSPIIYLADRVLAGEPLNYGVYGGSAVIRRSEMSDMMFRSCDQVLVGTNKLRNEVNIMFREKFRGIKNLEYPHINEKVICGKNNWSNELKKDSGFFLTNGTTGVVDDIDRSSYDGKSMIMDFKPDYSSRCFKQVKFDYNHMFHPELENINEDKKKFSYYDKMEFAYALTVHKFQGSQAEKIVYLHEDFMRDKEDKKKLLYTAITRAEKSIVIVL